MLRKIFSMSWRDHWTNNQLYGSLPHLSSILTKCQLTLRGQVLRHDQHAAQVLLWEPEARRKVSHPGNTLESILERETG